MWREVSVSIMVLCGPRLRVISELGSLHVIATTRDPVSAPHLSLDRPRLSNASSPRCFPDSYVPYNLPHEGPTLSSQSPPVVASSTRPNRPKWFLPQAQSRPPALKQLRPITTLSSKPSNTNQRPLACPMIPQRLLPALPLPNSPPPRRLSHRSRPPRRRWRLIRC